MAVFRTHVCNRKCTCNIHCYKVTMNPYVYLDSADGINILRFDVKINRVSALKKITLAMRRLEVVNYIAFSCTYTVCVRYI